jgi:hypothetical protein
MSFNLINTAKAYGFSSTTAFKSFVAKLRSKKTTIYLASGHKITANEVLALL